MYYSLVCVYIPRSWNFSSCIRCECLRSYVVLALLFPLVPAMAWREVKKFIIFIFIILFSCLQCSLRCQLLDLAVNLPTQRFTFFGVMSTSRYIGRHPTVQLHKMMVVNTADTLWVRRCSSHGITLYMHKWWIVRSLSTWYVWWGCQLKLAYYNCDVT